MPAGGQDDHVDHEVAVSPITAANERFWLRNILIRYMNDSRKLPRRTIVWSAILVPAIISLIRLKPLFVFLLDFYAGQEHVLRLGFVW